MAGAREPTSEVTMDAQAAIIAAVYGYAGGSSGESAGIIHGIAQTSTAEMSTAAKAMMRLSSTDEPMTCMAMLALVAPSARRMSSSCERCSMPANPMLIMPMADTDNSNIAVTVTPSWRKPMTCS